MIQILIIAFALFLPASAEVINLSPGSDLQATIDSAQDGDLINLAAGTYTGAIDLGEKSISIIGLGDESIIDANGEASAVRCSGGDALIDKVTITNGAAANGGGVYIVGSCNIRITRSTITNNSASSKGSAICITTDASPRFENNIISFNKQSGSTETHTIYTTGSKARFIRNTISNNTEPGNGFFITQASSRVRLQRNIIANNGENGVGRGTCVVQGAKLGRVRVQRNIFFNNSAGTFFINGTDFEGTKGVRRAQRRFGGSRFSRNKERDPSFTDSDNGIFTLSEDSSSTNFGAFSGGEDKAHL